MGWTFECRHSIAQELMLCHVRGKLGDVQVGIEQEERVDNLMDVTCVEK